MINIVVKSIFLIVISSIVGCEDVRSPQKVFVYSETMEVDGRTRHYVVNLPENYYESKDFSLVLALHGGGGSAEQMDKDYGMTQKAAKAGFILVYPEGVRSDGILGLRTWNAGNCCDYAMEQNIDDVKFLSLLIDKLNSAYKTNKKRVYLTGMSNGAMMAYRMACEVPDKIAAIAPVSGTMFVSDECKPGKPVPILHIHSKLDKKVPYFGGGGIAGYNYPAVDETLKFWAEKDGCVSVKETHEEGYDHSVWSACTGSVIIESYLTNDGGHAWPGSTRTRVMADTPSTVINANDLIWDFFQKFELP